MLPVLFEMGPLSVYAWGFTLSLAILAGTFTAIRLAKSIGIESDRILDLVIVLVIGGVVGARLFYVLIYEPDKYWREPLQVFAIWQGGLVYYGALIGGFISGTWYVIRKKLPFWPLADVVAPALALGYGIVRIGCFLNGCCYGTETGTFLGVVFPYIEGTPCLDAAPRYPTQLFSSLLGFGIFGLLLFLWKRRRFDGQIFLLFVILYSIGRSVVEVFRENLTVFGNITVSQLVSAVILVPAVILFWRKAREVKDEGGP